MKITRLLVVFDGCFSDLVLVVEVCKRPCEGCRHRQAACQPIQSISTRSYRIPPSILGMSPRHPVHHHPYYSLSPMSLRNFPISPFHSYSPKAIRRDIGRERADRILQVHLPNPNPSFTHFLPLRTRAQRRFRPPLHCNPTSGDSESIFW